MSNNTKKSIAQVHLIVSGRVQGVCFRWFVQDNARKFDINGWVKNCYNGTVEALLQGDKNIIEKLILIVKEGPALARVDNIIKTWDSPSQIFNDFQIRM